MKILKKVLLIFVILIALFAFWLTLKNDDKEMLISGYESFYVEEPNTDNLYKLCRELYGYNDYDRILIYYPLYLENNIAYDYITKSGKSEFIATQHIDNFKVDYCFALLHTSSYSEFENTFNKLKNEIFDINSIYYYLSAELETREYTKEQLLKLIDVLKKTENESLKHSKESFLSNLSLQAYICNLLGDEESYLTIVNEISDIERH